ncbi:MAG: hypothetical protein ABIO94_10835, partial [Opitutaceae bacterium]
MNRSRNEENAIADPSILSVSVISALDATAVAPVLGGVMVQFVIASSPAARDDEAIQLDFDECPSLGGHGALCAPAKEHPVVILRPAVIRWRELRVTSDELSKVYRRD